MKKHNWKARILASLFITAITISGNGKTSLIVDAGSTEMDFDQKEITIGENVTDTEQDIADTVIHVSAEDVLNYICIDDSAFAEKQSVNIWVSVGTDDTVLENAFLKLKIEQEDVTLEASEYEGNLLCFQVYLLEEMETYQLASVEYEIDGIGYEVSFENYDMTDLEPLNTVLGMDEVVASEIDGEVLDVDSRAEEKENEESAEEIPYAEEKNVPQVQGNDIIENTSSEELAFQWVTLGSRTIKIGSEVRLYYAVNKNAVVTVDIYYGDNRFLKRLEANKSIKTNDQMTAWDLKDASGEYVENGTYRYTVTATDEKGTTILEHRWFTVTGNDAFAFQWATLGAGTVNIGNEAKLYYAVNRNAAVTVDIYYGDNRFLKRLTANTNIKTNDQVAVWDLKDVAGNYVDNGLYRFTIMATDSKGTRISVHRWFNVTGNDPLAFRWATLGTGTVNIGNEAKLYYAVSRNATVTVDIYYGDNRFLKRLVSNADIKTNDQVAVWDLRDSSGEYVENGTYRYTITATDEKGMTETVHRWFTVKGNDSFAFQWTTLGSTQVARGSSLRLYYATNRKATVTVEVYYGNNRYMKTLVKNKNITTTDQVTEWNLTDENKRAVPAGLYRFTITAVDAKGNRVVSHKYFNVITSPWQPVIKEEELIVPGLQEEYNLLFVADSHMMTIDESDSQKVRDFEPDRVSGFVNRQGMKSAEQFPQIVEYANTHNVDVFLMGGDIIDYPSENNLGLLKGYLSELKCKYLYAPGNHDWTYLWEYMTETCRNEYRPLLNEFVDNGTLEAQMLEYEELILLAIDNSTNQIAPEAIPMLKQALNTGKPIVIMMHVPLQSDTLLEKVTKRWGSAIILGDDGIRPNAVSQEFLDMVFAKDSSVVAILDGHVHLSDVSRLDNGIMQYTANVGSSGEAILLRIKGK